MVLSAAYQHVPSAAGPRSSSGAGGQTSALRQRDQYGECLLRVEGGSTVREVKWPVQTTELTPRKSRCPLLAAPALEQRRERHLAAVLVLVRCRAGCPRRAAGVACCRLRGVLSGSPWGLLVRVRRAWQRVPRAWRSRIAVRTQARDSPAMNGTDTSVRETAATVHAAFATSVRVGLSTGTLEGPLKY